MDFQENLILELDFRHIRQRIILEEEVGVWGMVELMEVLYREEQEEVTEVLEQMVLAIVELVLEVLLMVMLI